MHTFCLPTHLSQQVTGGVNPAGMTIKATCCPAYDAPSDDAIAMDYSSICNSASRNTLSLGVLAAVLAASVYLVV